MRVGQTVIVCGADGDRAQFEPFAWPAYASLWIGVGCGNVGSIGQLSPTPSDATDHERVEVARAYVRAVRDPPPDVEGAVVALAGWLCVLERAARVPCAMIVACGGVRVYAAPVFRAWWTRRTITVVGGEINTTVRREHGDVKKCALDVLSSHGVDTEHGFVPWRCRDGSADLLEMHPVERCALCHTPIRSGLRVYARATPVGADESTMWLPTLGVCGECPVRAFSLWRTFHFSIEEGKIRALEAPTAGSAAAAMLWQGAHESVWLANARVVETLALALASRAVPREGTFAASLAATMCDLKLLRIVAERMLPPPARVCANRALACLVERVVR